MLQLGSYWGLYILAEDNGKLWDAPKRVTLILKDDLNWYTYYKPVHEEQEEVLEYTVVDEEVIEDKTDFYKWELDKMWIKYHRNLWESKLKELYDNNK